jgi:phosphatidylglycerophosphate synthase
MLGDFLREKTGGTLKKVGKELAFLPFSANLFSALAIVWSGLFVLFLLSDAKLLATIFFLLSVVWDGIDGAYAFAKNDVTKFGYYIEGIIDKWAEIVVYLGLFLVGYHLEMMLFTSFAIMLSYTKPRAAVIVYIGEFDWPAIGERLERLLIITIGLFFYLFNINEVQLNNQIIDISSVIFYVGIVILLIGNVQRMLFAGEIIKKGGIKDLRVKDRLKKLPK